MVMTRSDAGDRKGSAGGRRTRHTTQGSGGFLSEGQALLEEDLAPLEEPAPATIPRPAEDLQLRDRITSFDQELTPERAIFARGIGAHGHFQVYEPLHALTRAAFLQDPADRTPVFVRFSSATGSRGGADTLRDLSGFAVKFYSADGAFDLVGNNMPVFFLQDASRFSELLQALRAADRDAFWDFASVTPESTHLLMWLMSDRALPRSYATMEGFGVHTFRFVNAAGRARFVKFHWKPLAGVRSLRRDEAQDLAQREPDFLRKDLCERIRTGCLPEWELGVQVIEEKDREAFDFDLLDPTKLVPEERVPVRRIGKLTLERNADNLFAESEQVAFHPGHLVPGIDFTDDPLLQGRLFAYLDAQQRRLGPNFAERPINRPLAQLHDNRRDALGRPAIEVGRVGSLASPLADALGAGCPIGAGGAPHPFLGSAGKREDGPAAATRPGFADHFSQARLFWNSMAAWEKRHIVDGFASELSRVEDRAVRGRVLSEILANVDEALATAVAERVGLTPPDTRGSAGSGRAEASPALSMDRPFQELAGCRVAILLADGVASEALLDLRQRLEDAGVRFETLAETAGQVKAVEGRSLDVDRTAAQIPSLFYDALLLPGGAGCVETLARSDALLRFVLEAWRHCKPIAALGEGGRLLQQAVMGIAGRRPQPGLAPGVLTTERMPDLDDFAEAFRRSLQQHRHFERRLDPLPQ